jgi:hypothetical protein
VTNSRIRLVGYAARIERIINSHIYLIDNLKRKSLFGWAGTK